MCTPQGLGTDDRALIRIMVSRSETDLFNIRKEFKETHDASLHEFIQVETMIVSPSPCLLTLVCRVYCLLIICHPSVVLEFASLSWAIVCAAVAHPFSAAVVRWCSTASCGDWWVCSQCTALQEFPCSTSSVCLLCRCAHRQSPRNKVNSLLYNLFYQKY